MSGVTLRGALDEYCQQDSDDQTNDRDRRVLPVEIRARALLYGRGDAAHALISLWLAHDDDDQYDAVDDRGERPDVCQGENRVFTHLLPQSPPSCPSPSLQLFRRYADVWIFRSKSTLSEPSERVPAGKETADVPLLQPASPTFPQEL